MEASKIEFLLEELEARRASLGDNHSSVAETLIVLGLTYSFIEHDYKKAIYYHRAALKIQITKITNPRQLIDVATTLSDIGNCHMFDGEFLMAKRMILQAKIIMDRSKLNDDHPRSIMFVQSTRTRLDYMNRSNIFIPPLEHPIKRCKSSIIKSYSTMKGSTPSVNKSCLSASDLSCFNLVVGKRSTDMNT